ncbi:MAG: transporter substrate-binding domain-containing protein, partial [Mesorhizobium sp.]
ITAMSDPETLGHGMGVGMRKGNAQLKAKVDAALCNMIDGGKIKESSLKWFKDDYTIPCKK